MRRRNLLLVTVVAVGLAIPGPAVAEDTARFEITVPAVVHRLEIDGVVVQVVDGVWAADVAAGEHTVRATGPGYSPTELTLRLEPGDTSRFEMQLFNDIEHPMCSPRRITRRAWAPYLVTGLGVGAALTGGFLLTRDDRSAAAVPVLAVGGATIAAGVALVVLNRPCPGYVRAPAGVSFGASVSRELTGLTARLRF